MTTVQEHNVATGEVIVRDMTEAEMAQIEIDKAEIQVAKKAAKAAQLAKENAQAKLEALGLTGDDLRALGL